MAVLHDDNYAELTLATFVVDFRVFAKGLSRAAELLRRGAEKAFFPLSGWKPLASGPEASSA